MPALWISPLRDVHGFLRRYCVAAGGIAVVGVAMSLIADRTGNYALSSLLPSDALAHMCNVSIVARLVFVLLAAMELVTAAALLLVAVNRCRRLPKGAPALNLPRLGIGGAIAEAALLLFLHLGLYGIAFHADGVCTVTSVGVWLRHYSALVSFAALYILGSVILIGLVMVALKPMLLAK
jgi:hypothetical protein